MNDSYFDLWMEDDIWTGRNEQEDKYFVGVVKEAIIKTSFGRY